MQDLCPEIREREGMWYFDLMAIHSHRFVSLSGCGLSLEYCLSMDSHVTDSTEVWLVCYLKDRSSDNWEQSNLRTEHSENSCKKSTVLDRQDWAGNSSDMVGRDSDSTHSLPC